MFHASMPYTLGKDFPAVPYHLIGDHLTVDLVYDQPNTMVVVNEEQLQTWKVSFTEALAAARENLWGISNENFLEIQPGLYRTPWEDSHGAARLFLHDLIWHLEVKGQHVVLAPTRDGLLVTGSEDGEGLRRMAELGEKLVEETRSISGVPVMLDGDRWRTCHHDHEGRAFPELRELCIRWEAQEYDSQKQDLDRWHAKQGEEVFVSPVMLLRSSDTGELRSVGVWARGADTLLPKATHVGFVSREDGLNGIMATWEDTRQATGDLMQPCGMYPERYRVTSFPTVEQIERIKCGT
jgi:hypothetical protein